MTFTVGGNVTLTDGDLNTGEEQFETSPMTLHIGGNFTAVDPFNLRLANSTIDRSLVSIAGRSTITNDHSQIVFSLGTFGPITVQNIDDPFGNLYLFDSTVDGSVNVIDNTDAFATAAAAAAVLVAVAAAGTAALPVVAPTNVHAVGPAGRDAFGANIESGRIQDVEQDPFNPQHLNTFVPK